MSLNIVFRDPATLKPAEDNAKEHGEAQITAIANSITNFGFDQPIVVDQNDVIIKGHGRRLAAMQLGLKSIPVIVRKVTPAAAVLNRVLDNHLVSQNYDQFMLREDLTMLNSAGQLNLTGITAEQIPDVYKSVARLDAQLFPLTTKHKCPKCTYRF